MTVEAISDFFFVILVLAVVMPVLMVLQFHLTLAAWSFLDAIGADKVYKRYLDRLDNDND